MNRFRFSFLFLLLFGCIQGFAQLNFTPIAQLPHPRLLLKAGSEQQIIQSVNRQPELKKVHELILAEALRMQDLPALEHKKIGRRLLSVSREAIRRIFYQSYAYRMTGDRKMLQSAYQNAATVAGFADWNPTHFLDVAEMTLAVAIGYDWLYKDLTQEQRNHLEQAIIEKGLETSLVPEYARWQKNVNNWNQVCNAGLSFGAVAVFHKNPELSKKVLDRAVKTIRIPMKEYGPDGAYPEGYSYWSYGTSFNVMFLDVLQGLIGQDAGLSQMPGFLQTGNYLQHMVGPTGQPYNYSDAGSGAELNGAMFWFAQKLNQPSLVWNELKFIQQRSNGLVSERLLPLVLIWSKDVSLHKMKPPVNQFWTGGGLNPVLLMRSSWTNPNALYLGFKTGSPQVSHGHMDQGSFVFEAEGVRWALDLGMQSYESLESKGMQIWGREQNAQRWTIFRYTNFAHNTLTINDSLLRVSGNTVIDQQGQRSGFTFGISNLSAMYGNMLAEARRGVALVQDAYGLIQDELRTNQHPAKLRWSLVTAATVEVVSDKEVLLKQKGKTLRLSIEADQPITIKTWSTTPNNDYDAPNPGTSIIGFEALLPANTSARFSVALIPEKNTPTSIQPVRPLSAWK